MVAARSRLVGIGVVRSAAAALGNARVIVPIGVTLIDLVTPIDLTPGRAFGLA
jgi:hypothetical protein